MEFYLSTITRNKKMEYLEHFLFTIFPALRQRNPQDRVYVDRF